MSECTSIGGLRPLLLRNAVGTVDQNACFSNSIIQILRRIPEFKNAILALPPQTMVHLHLKKIFETEGTNNIISTSQLRRATGRPFASGNQQDCLEFFNKLIHTINIGLDTIFRFKVKNTFKFINTKFSPACQFC